VVVAMVGERWWSDTVVATHMTCDPSFKLTARTSGLLPPRAGHHPRLDRAISCMPGYELVLRKQGCMLQVIRRKLT